MFESDWNTLNEYPICNNGVAMILLTSHVHFVLFCNFLQVNNGKEKDWTFSIITYACAVRIFSASEMHRCHVAINNAIKKIYSFAIWQSIRDIRTSNGYKSIYEIFAFTRKKFMEAALSSSNQVVAHLVSELPIDL